MMKTYRLHNFVRITLFLAVSIFGYVLWDQWKNNEINPFLLVCSFASGIILLLGWSAKIQITNRKFINMLPLLGIKRTKKMENIHFIVDDHFWKLHIFRLSTDGKKPFGGISNGIANYRDLLREIILRVPKKCRIDESILQQVGLTKSDIGKLFSSSERSG